MSNNNGQQPPHHRRSASVEIVDVKTRDQNINSQQPAQQATHRRAVSSNAKTRSQHWDATMGIFGATRRQSMPPQQTVSMYNLTVGHSDLTELYSAQYPFLDYGNSFSAAGAAHLPEQVRHGMERRQPAMIPDGMPLRHNVRRDGRFLPPRPPVQQAPAAPRPSTQAASASNTTAAAPAPVNTAAPPPATRPPVQQAPVVPGPSTQAADPTSTTAPGPSAPNTNPLLAPTPQYTTQPASATQKELDTITRQHNLNINDPRLYKAGTAQIPMDVAALVDQIKGLKQGNAGYPTRTALKENMGGHFKQSGGVLKYDSVLWQWYGDLRLFSRREWYYLVSEGRGVQVPWST